MISNQNEKIKRCIAFFQKLPWLAGEWLFLSLLICTLIAVISGAIIFYQYAVLAPKTEPQVKLEVIKFQRDDFLDLVARWEERQAQFNAALEKNYPNPF